MNYVIEDNLPPPAPSRKTGRPRGYSNPLLLTLDQLKPGQHIKLTEVKQAQMATQASSKWRPKKFTTRKLRIDDWTGWIVWRLE